MQDKLLYETNYLGSSVKVFPDRVVFKMLFKETSIPVHQISSVELGIMGHMQVIIETSGGKKYKIPTTKKNEVREAIYKAQSGSETSNNNVADEIKKLSDLKEKGIITQEEFDRKKKQLLEG